MFEERKMAFDNIGELHKAYRMRLLQLTARFSDGEIDKKEYKETIRKIEQALKYYMVNIASGS